MPAFSLPSDDFCPLPAIWARAQGIAAATRRTLRAARCRERKARMVAGRGRSPYPFGANRILHLI